jgi:hypothetical protein
MTRRNQGEGDYESSRKYDHDVRKFVNEGKVERAASDAKKYVEEHPEEAAKAGATSPSAREHDAKKGPSSFASVDDLVAKGRTMFDRVRRTFDRMKHAWNRR